MTTWRGCGVTVRDHGPWSCWVTPAATAGRPAAERFWSFFSTSASGGLRRGRDGVTLQHQLPLPPGPRIGQAQPMRSPRNLDDAQTRQRRGPGALGRGGRMPSVRAPARAVGVRAPPVRAGPRRHHPAQASARPPTPVAPTATVAAAGRPSSLHWRLRPAWTSASAIYRRAPANGTGSNTACSPRSPGTGVAKLRTWKKAIQVMSHAAAVRPRYLAHWAWVKPAAS